MDEDAQHPAACMAMEFLASMDEDEQHRWLSVFNSMAITGDEEAELYAETLSRLQIGEEVSDRDTRWGSLSISSPREA